MPLLLLTLFEVSSQSSSRYYMDPARCSAVLVVSTTKKGWKIEGHWSRQPGARQGEPLRELVVGPLMKAADEAHIVVYGTAATKKLADAYRKQVPELEIIGRSYIRGWRLRRDPRSAN